MKKFLINSIVFCLFPLLVIFLAIGVIYNHYYVTLKELSDSYQHIAQNELIIAGDSQAQRINGSLINSNHANIGSSGEHYFFTYRKLQKLLSNSDNQVKQVLLGTSIHNFAPVYSKLINAQLPEGKKSVKLHLYFLTINDLVFLSGSYKNIPFSTIKEALNKDVKTDGFYESTNSNPSDSVINRIFNSHYASSTSSAEFAKYQKEYLLKIDSLCHDKNVELYLVSTPYHIKYKRQIDSAYISYFEQAVNETSWSHHINFLADTTEPSLLSDANHLNKDGSEIYSKQIKELIRVD